MSTFRFRRRVQTSADSASGSYAHHAAGDAASSMVVLDFDAGGATG
jgi:hypothetical protein